MENSKLETATLAAGCFWCYEPVFKMLEGVESVTSGYTGGSIDNPNYMQVSTQDTGHAESVNVEFDPEVITYKQLLEVFFEIHDPTQLDRQGNDIGKQYRSAIFYHNDEQKKIAEKLIQDLTAAKKYDKKIVTEVVPINKFYTAEEYHQNFYDKNPQVPYCNLIITPKIKKFKENFKSLLKEEYAG